jgi:hypothetical protein
MSADRTVNRLQGGVGADSFFMTFSFWTREACLTGRVLEA